MAVGDGHSRAIADSRGHGNAQLPTWLLSQQLDVGTLVEVLPQPANNGLSIDLVWLKSRQSLPKPSALLDAVAACLTPAGRRITRSAVPR